MNGLIQSRRHPARIGVLAAALCALAAPPAASAATITQSFPGGQETAFTVPEGIRLIDVEATGGKGGDSLGSASKGGLGARVTGSLTVTPGEDLFVVVGTNGAEGPAAGVGGFNGGGSGSSSGNTTTAGGGGGGATDIRTVSRFESDSLASRLLVAAGGGGAGGRGGNSTIGNQTYQGGIGGGGGAAGSNGSAAGADGADGAGSGTNGGSVDANTRGRGGKGASTGAQGTGGAPGTNGGGNGTAGGSGGLGAGGNGSTGMTNSPQGRGGGGGAGLFGGGGGGSSTANSTAGAPNVGGGGGGGAGSSLVPSGGTVATAPAGSTGSASISYTFADTTLSGPLGPIRTPSPTYELSSPDDANATFECSVDGADFTPCEADYSPGPLSVGDHQIRARAVDPDTGNADPLPAVVEVEVQATTVRLGTPKLNRRQGTAVLPVTVDRAGSIVATGNGVRRASASADEAGTSRLSIKATGSAAKRLRKTGKATLRVQVAFTPAEGDAATERTTVKLVRQQRRR